MIEPHQSMSETSMYQMSRLSKHSWSSTSSMSLHQPSILHLEPGHRSPNNLTALHHANGHPEHTLPSSTGVGWIRNAPNTQSGVLPGAYSHTASIYAMSTCREKLTAKSGCSDGRIVGSMSREERRCGSTTTICLMGMHKQRLIVSSC